MRTALGYALGTAVISLLPLAFPIVIALEIAMIGQLARKHQRCWVETIAVAITVLIISVPFHAFASVIVILIGSVGWIVEAAITFLYVLAFGKIADGYFARRGSSQARAMREALASARSVDSASRTSTVIDNLLLQTKREAFAATCALAAALVVYVGRIWLVGASQRIWVVAALLASVILVNVQAVIISYRVARGLFGTNEYEARQIIRFLLDDSEFTDLSGGLGARELNVDEYAYANLEADWAKTT